MVKKSDIVERVIVRNPSLDRRIISAVVDRFFEILSDTLTDHNRIELRGFASFSIRSYNITDYSVMHRLKKEKYFKVYFRSSKIISNLINRQCKQ